MAELMGQPGPIAGADVRRTLVGERLRRLRRLRNLSLEVLAKEVDLSPSFISMLERGQADISLSRFVRLAEYFGVRPSELLLEEVSRRQPTIVGEADGNLVDRGPGITYRVLTHDRSGAQVIHARLEPHSRFKDLLVHTGVDFVWILSGMLTLLYGDQQYELAQGKLVHYEGASPHAFANDTDEPSELLGFATPAYW